MQWKVSSGATIIAVVEASKYLTLLYMVHGHIAIGAALIAIVEAGKYLVLRWMVK